MKLYPYQREAVDLLKRRDGKAALFMAMGTGKTPTAISYLARERFKRILVVCPVAAVGVWRKQLRELKAPWDVVTLEGGSVERATKRLKLLRATSGTRVVIVNLDAYWRYPPEHKNVTVKGVRKVKRFPLRGVRRALLRWGPDAIVIDEAHRIANRTTAQSKFAHELASLPTVRARIPLTGSPIDEGVEDLFSIYKFMDPSIFGSNYGDFERRFIIRGGFGGYQIVGYKNRHIIERILARTSFRVTDEVLGLPERVSQEVPIALSPRNRKLYESMKRDSLLELEMPGPDGEPLRGRALTAIVLTTLLRLQQLANGFIPVVIDDASGEAVGEPVITDVGDDKLNTAVELIENALREKRQVVVFVKFIHDMERLLGALPHQYKLSKGVGCRYCGKAPSKHLKPLVESEVGTISGNVGISGPAKRRDATREAFAAGRLKVLIVQTDSGAESIDLTAATVALFYSVGHSLRKFSQARGRLYRHGQTRHVIEYMLQVEHSVDEQIYDALRKKQSIAKEVMTLAYAKRLLGA